ncbi:MAG TPA: glycosyltransferase [Blastocatellia bacterium]|nr:glycosyltransferase [Blastocatellia bacterium]
MKDQVMPKVSICVPTYNSARYLPQAIESVLKQEFSDYELVILDNASTDNTTALCSGYTDARVRYLRFEELTNQAGNFNRCLKEARGEYLMLLHADDFLLSGFLADRVSRLENDPDTGFVFGAVKIVDAEDEITSTKSQWNEDRLFQPGELLDHLLLGCIVSPPSMLVRKSVADEAGPFRTDLTWGHDWDWAIRLAEKSAVRYGSKPLAAYRVHDDSGTAEVLSAAKNGRQERVILKETLARLSDKKRSRELRRKAFRALSLRHMYFAEQSLFAGRKRALSHNLWYAMRADVRMLARPTFWALTLSLVGPVKWYSRYRVIRNNPVLENHGR